MKKLIALTIIMALFLCGCGAQEVPVQQTEPVIQTEPVEVPTEAPTEANAEETEAPEVGLRVEDRYSEEFDHPSGEGKFCVHIPQFVLDGNRELTINGKIHNDHMSKIHKNGQIGVPTVSVAYAVGQTEEFASVITCFSQLDYDAVEYSVFNISVSSGKEVTDEKLLAAFGHTPDSFFKTVRDVMEKQFALDNSAARESLGEEAYQEALAEHLSKENITGAKPFIDEAGQLCFAVKCYTFAGAGYYYTRICLDNPARYPAPQSITCAEHQ